MTLFIFIGRYRVAYHRTLEHDLSTGNLSIRFAYLPEEPHPQNKHCS
jgi:hypothetical protein